jgi:phosphogluconate dehydratase
VRVPQDEWNAREPALMPVSLRESDSQGLGRELFANFRRNAAPAEKGACTWL